ncbi:MAG: hypothetical protein ACKO5Q_27485, partial [Microcystaceae cyanobacterium]
VRQIFDLKNSVSTTAEAIQAFHYAVKALSSLLASLSDAELFWFSIKIYCKQLKNSSVANSVQNYHTLNLSADSDSNDIPVSALRDSLLRAWLNGRL